MLDTAKKVKARFVPSEIVHGLRLSKSLPLDQGARDLYDKNGLVEVNIVHADEFGCLGYLLKRSFDPNCGGRTYYVYTADLGEAARLTTLEEQELKEAVEMPEPIDHSKW